MLQNRSVAGLGDTVERRERVAGCGCNGPCGARDGAIEPPWMGLRRVRCSYIPARIQHQVREMPGPSQRPERLQKIGRASCRERVEIAEGAGSLGKKSLGCVVTL